MSPIQAGLYPAGNDWYIDGFGAAGTAIDLHATPDTAAFIIGTRARHRDGREIVYGQTAAAVAAAVVCAPDISSKGLADTDDGVNDSVAAGEYTFRFDLNAFSSIAVNQFAGSVLMITDDAGEGYSYYINSNIATENTDEITVTLEEDIHVALTTSSDVAIAPPMYGELITADCNTGTDVVPTCVSVSVLADNDFGWFATRGFWPILQDGSIAIGNSVTNSDGTAGAVQLKDAETEALIGTCVYAGDTTGHGVFKVQL
tara:strand:+ start:278 stop:1051 length:774 start_codon:yes stop_codon:yes gene_type:complete